MQAIRQFYEDAPSVGEVEAVWCWSMLVIQQHLGHNGCTARGAGGNGQGEFGLALYALGILEKQRQRNGAVFGQGLFQIHQHDVVGTRFEFHGLSGRQIQSVLHGAHLHDVVIHLHFMNFHDSGYRAGDRHQPGRLLSSDFHESAGCLLTGNRCARPGIGNGYGWGGLGV